MECFESIDNADLCDFADIDNWRLSDRPVFYQLLSSELSPYGLLANLLAMPVMGLVVMPAALIAMIVMPFGLDYYPLQVMGQGIEIVIDVAKYVASLGDDITIERLPQWFLPAISLTLLIPALLRTSIAIIAILPLGIILTSLAIFKPDVPSLVIHETGELIAIINNDNIATNRGKPSDFIFSNWQRSFGIHQHSKAPIIKVESETVEPQPDIKEHMIGLLDVAERNRAKFICSRHDICVAKVDAIGTIIQIKSPEFLGPACELADILIIPAQLRLQKCRSGALLITGRKLRQSGTLEIYAGDKIEERHSISQALNGAKRHWTIHRYYDWKDDTYKDYPILSDSGE